MRALPLLFFLSLALSACGSGKECEQPTEVVARIQNQSGATLTLGFEFWSDHQSKVETLTLSIDGLSLEKRKLADSSYTKRPHYQGKVGAQAKNAECSAKPEERITSGLYLSSASFDLAKLCHPLSGDTDVVLVDKLESCPAGSREQTRAGYPQSGSTPSIKRAR